MDGLDASVDDLLDQAQLMKGLVPELSLRLGREHAVAGTGQRRRYDECSHPVRKRPSDGLSDAAPDVITGQHRRPQAELVDESDNAPRLRVG